MLLLIIFFKYLFCGILVLIFKFFFHLCIYHIIKLKLTILSILIIFFSPFQYTMNYLEMKSEEIL
jgi:hypothetical protein